MTTKIKPVMAWGYLRDDGILMPDARNARYIAVDDKEPDERVVRVRISVVPQPKKVRKGKKK